MSANRLTQKQDAFCNAYIEHGNAIRAYREAGYKCDTWSAKMISTEASALMKNPGISRKIAESREKATGRAELTLQGAITKAQDLCDKAVELGQMGAAVSAATLADKLSGFMVERNLDLNDKDDPIRKLMGEIAGSSRYKPDAAAHNAEQQRLAEIAKGESTEEDDEQITHVDFARTGSQ